MGALVLECDPKMLQIDECVYPDLDASYVYDHLKYYCSKFSPLPAVTIALRDASPLIVRGHKFASIASELGRKSIRAIITADIDTDEVRRFLGTDGVNTLDWEMLRKEEEETNVLNAVHVFFFDASLSGRQKCIFEERIAGFFHKLTSVLIGDKPRTISKVIYSHNERCAEFTATTPAGDPSWFGEFHACCLDYSREVAHIASYQGRRFVS
jgi:hypothetical protein